MTATVILQHLFACALGALVLLQALCIGYAVLAPLRKRWGPQEGDGPSLGLSLALGLGLLSHGLWLMASLCTLTGWHLFHPWLAWASFVLVAVALHGSNRRLIAAVKDRLRTGMERFLTLPVWILPLVLVIGGFILFRFFVFASSPSYQYDVLEYHEPIVRQILDRSSIALIPGIAYTRMPLGAHMLYAWGGLFIGDLAPSALKIMNIWFGLSAAFLVSVGIAQWRLGVGLRLLAVGVFLAHPLGEELLADAFIDMALALYVTAAAVALVRAMRLPNRLDPVLAAVLLGFGLSSKYPVAGVAIVPMLVVFGFFLPPASLPAFLARRNVALRWVGTVFLGGVIVGLSFGPWALRGLLVGGSFFPPITGRWIGEAPSPEHQALEAFMQASHAVEFPPDGGFIDRLRGNIPDVGWWIFLSALLAAALPAVDRRTRALALVLALGYLVWNLAPRGEYRFLAPLFGMMAIVAVAIARDATRRWFGSLGVLVLVPLGAWSLLYFINQTRFILQPGTVDRPVGALMRRMAVSDYPETFFRTGIHGEVTGRLFNAIRKAVGPEDKILFVYEARLSIVPREAQGRINTVFDPSPLWEILRSERGASPQAVLEALGEQGYSLVAVNEVELARLLAAYPAIEAWGDPAYRDAAARSGSYIDLLPFKEYYPPHFYFSGSAEERREVLRRLDAFMEFLWNRTGPYSDQLGPARLMVRPLR